MPVVDARPVDVAWPAMSWPPAPDAVLTGQVVAVTPVDPERDAEALFGALDDERVWEHLPFRVADPDAYRGSCGRACSRRSIPGSCDCG